MKKRLFISFLSVLFILSFGSCGAMSNMSGEDAYSIGYGAGTLMRNIIDN